MDNFLDIRLFELAGTPITVATVVTFVVIIAATLMVSRILTAATARAFRIRKVTHEGTIKVMRRLVHYLVLLVGLGIAFETVGIDLSTLFAAGALFAVAIGFAMQNISENFVSGIILLVERSIKPGDIIELEGRLMQVSTMGIRATVARTLDEEEVIIPNTYLVQSTVKNFTLSDAYYRMRALVGVIYGSDMALVRSTLETVVRSLPWRVQSVEPRILMKQFGNSSVDFEVSVWIGDPWKKQALLSDLHEAIWWSLKEAGIVIAFPQLDVHFDPPIAESVEKVGRYAARLGK